MDKMSNLVLGDKWLEQGNGSRVVLPLTQCSIHCESSSVVHGANVQKRALQTTCDTPVEVQKESIYETELE